MKNTFLLALLLIGFIKYASAQSNTILIIADDMGTDYCGFYEDAADTAKMPNIRSLLSRGVRFKNAWGTPLCSPTRASIITGRYPFRHGVGTVIDNMSLSDLDTSEMALPKLLRNNAPTRFSTAQVGKWHLSKQSTATLNYPKIFGYDYFSGLFVGAMQNYSNWTKITNGVSRTVTTYATTETVNDAISWLDTVQRNKPFFLWMGFNAPHSPFHSPPDSLHTVQGLTGTTQHINQNPKLYYKAMIEALDTEIGRLISYLHATNRFQNTNIIFIGDNGQVRQISQINDLTHVKGTLYQYGVRIPFIISGPSVVQPNRVSDALVSVTDLYSTILEMSDFTNWSNSIPLSKQPTDAQSILPILKNTATQVRTWNFTEQFKATPDSIDGKAIRNSIYKLIHFENNKQAFYNLITDPNEQTNLLTRALTSTELSNYISLCNQLFNLVGGAVPRCIISKVDDIQSIVKVYPTIFSQNITLETVEPITYTLYNSMGHNVLIGKGIGSMNISLSDIPQGIYFLKYQIRDMIAVKKLVKM